ncbi:uncharacterized protein LOC128729082 [Anopheles nili]|uniref:uncharacterized protein LOC128729082 n=1 Tax=Anopheles nili TaxID=185578 RepID=UPI00237A86F0|nr:uncharacterized protein LOC128729082 [Anopheles nili]
MVRFIARLWANALLLITLCNGEDGKAVTAPAKTGNSCLSAAGVVFNLPPVVCRPMASCDQKALLKHYSELHSKCRIDSSERLKDRELFLFRANYWVDDHKFLFELIQNWHQQHSLVLDAEQMIRRTARLGQELRRKLYIYSIEAGRIEDALMLHVTLANHWTAQQIIDAIATNPNINEVVCVHLLEFARSIPVKTYRAELYKAMKPLLVKHNLINTYVVLLYSADAASVLTTPSDKDEYVVKIVGKIVSRLRDLLIEVNFEENLWIAEQYPDYYSYHIATITTFNRQQWHAMIKRRFFEFANMLRPKNLRFHILETSIAHIEMYEKNREKRQLMLLPVLAKEVDRLRSFVMQTGKHKHELQRLEKLEKRFNMGKSKNPNYQTYLNHFKVNGKMGKKHKELERLG